MTASALAVLAALQAATSARNRPGPAALIGDWAGGSAVIAPSVALSAGQPLPDRPDRFWFGYYGFGYGGVGRHGGIPPLPDVVGGLSDDALFLRDGQWTYQHVDDAPCPDWIAECLSAATRSPTRVGASNDGAASSHRSPSGPSEAHPSPNNPSHAHPAPNTPNEPHRSPSEAHRSPNNPSEAHRSPSRSSELASSTVSRCGDLPFPAQPPDVDTSSTWSATWHSPDRAPHVAAIAECLEAIRAGEIYQACVCTQFTGHLDGDPLEFFTDIAAATQPTKAAYLQGDWGTVASFSPELFLHRDGPTVWSSPIKGTVAAADDPASLRASVKDVAENIMIVDLVRNDLGRVARIGSVTVPDLLSVVPAPGVWHLVSTVRATLDADVGNDALLAATFPPASVTGTPKLRACELLADWESVPRGVYCGAIGFAGPDDQLELNVAIRTVSITPDGAATLGVGGGITIDSDPAREWQECLDKASSIVGFTPPGP